MRSPSMFYLVFKLNCFAVQGQVLMGWVLGVPGLLHVHGLPLDGLEEAQHAAPGTLENRLALACGEGELPLLADAAQLSVLKASDLGPVFRDDLLLLEHDAPLLEQQEPVGGYVHPVRFLVELDAEVAPEDDLLLWEQVLLYGHTHQWMPRGLINFTR